MKERPQSYYPENLSLTPCLKFQYLPLMLSLTHSSLGCRHRESRSHSRSNRYNLLHIRHKIPPNLQLLLLL